MGPGGGLFNVGFLGQQMTWLLFSEEKKASGFLFWPLERSFTFYHIPLAYTMSTPRPSESLGDLCSQHLIYSPTSYD